MSRESVTVLVPMAAGCLLSIFVLFWLGNTEKVELDEVALGGQTTGVDATFNGTPIRCGTVKGIAGYWRGWNRRGSRPYILLLGNSQLHAINQLKAGEVGTPQLLFNNYHPRNIDVLAFTLANATLTEAYVSFEYVALQARPAIVVIAACFDDTRNDALREEFPPLFIDAGLQRVLSKTESGQELLRLYYQDNSTLVAASKGGGATPVTDGFKGLLNSLQEPLEVYLNGVAIDGMPYWDKRAKMRGDIFLNLYKLRNRVFGITPQSKRRLILPRYAQQMSALDSMLMRYATLHIPVLVYIAPLRDDIPSPYIDNEYARFKTEVAEKVKQYGAWYEDFENLVPGEYWGETSSTDGSAGGEVDFMHFQGYGHKLLGDAIIRAVDKMLKLTQSTPSEER